MSVSHMELKTKTSSFCTFVRYSAGMPVWSVLWLVEILVDGQNFPSHWPSGRLLYESTIVRKLNVYSFSNKKTDFNSVSANRTFVVDFFDFKPKVIYPKYSTGSHNGYSEILNHGLIRVFYFPFQGIWVKRHSRLNWKFRMLHCLRFQVFTSCTS